LTASRCSHSGTCALVALASLLFLPDRAVAVGPRLVVVDLSPETLPAPYAELNLGEELGRALEAAGCHVERTCTTEECAVPTGPAGQAHILSFDMRYDRQQFACSISLEVRDRPGGRVEYREKASSPVCPAAEALEDTKRAARLACDELRKSPARSSGRIATSPSPGNPTGSSNVAAAAVVMPPPAPPLLLDTSPGIPEHPADLYPERALQIGALAAGAAALAGGAVLLYLNGKPTSCARSPEGDRVCTRTRQTGVIAIPLLVLGAGGAGWGAWRLLSPAPDLLVGVSGRGLSVRATF
jgi:hypothetical protein